jgi:hypothetical protein
VIDIKMSEAPRLQGGVAGHDPLIKQKADTRIKPGRVLPAMLLTARGALSTYQEGEVVAYKKRLLSTEWLSREITTK